MGPFHDHPWKDTWLTSNLALGLFPNDERWYTISTNIRSMDPDLAPLWGATASHQLPPRVSSGSSSPDEKAQGVKPGGGDKTKTDKKKRTRERRIREKRIRERREKMMMMMMMTHLTKSMILCLMAMMTMIMKRTLGWMDLVKFWRRKGKRETKASRGQPKSRQPASQWRDHRQRRAMRIRRPLIQLNSMYPALMFVVRLKWGTFYFYLMHIM